MGKYGLADELVNCYECMFDYIDEGRDHVLYRMEDEPATAGVRKDRGDVPKSVVDNFIAEIRERVIEPNREFFERFYECL